MVFAEERETPAVVAAFLDRFLDDCLSGPPRELEHYRSQFPHWSEVVAEEYSRLTEVEPEPRADAMPRELGRYRLLRELGRGGQAVVYLADDTVLPRRVAVKVLRSPSPERLARFEKEAEVTARLDHPGIAGVLDAGIVGDRAYIAMRYVEGRPLARAIETARRSREPWLRLGGDASAADYVAAARPQPLLELLRFGEEAARALHVAHEAGVLHRDLKPANVMVTPEGRPVILDFGFAWLEDDAHASLTLQGEVFGTPAYMPPEQLRSESTIRTRSADVYALAATLYEAFTLHRPFEARERQRLFREILQKDAPDPRVWNPRLPPDLGVVLLKGLEKEPQRRYASALGLAEDLRRVRCHEPISARPISPLGRLARWTRRSPVLAASLFALFCTLTVSLVVVGSMLARTREESDDRQVIADRFFVASLDDRLDDLWPQTTATVAREDGIDDTLRLLAGTRARVETYRGRLAAGDHDRETKLGMVDVVRSADRLAAATAALEARREFARTVRSRTVGAHRGAWETVCDDVEDDPRFGGLRLPPIEGLIPLGPDPDSGLEEFAHLASGPPAVRDADTGQLRYEDATGIVLVLLPGGSFVMGSPSSEAARGDRETQRQLMLRPFLLGKHEVTQAQWLAIIGREPSERSPGRQPGKVTYRHPVDSVAWHECVDFGRRTGLTLPTEAQWEFASRGGRPFSQPFYWGQDEEALRNRENVQFEDDVELRVAIPVGDLAANGLGLFDLHGNVCEWVLDEFQHEYPPVAALDPDGRLPDDGTLFRRVFRGGSWALSSMWARSAKRHAAAPTSTHIHIGLRAAMPVSSRR